MLSRSESLGHRVDVKTAIGARPNRSDNRLGTSSTDSISVGVRPPPVPSPVAATSAGVEARFQTCLAPSSESTAVLRNHSAKGWLPHVPSCSKSKIKSQKSKIPGFSNLYNYVLWREQMRSTPNDKTINPRINPNQANRDPRFCTNLHKFAQIFISRPMQKNLTALPSS
jgi:hypothetical protein